MRLRNSFRGYTHEIGINLFKALPVCCASCCMCSLALLPVD